MAEDRNAAARRDLGKTAGDARATRTDGDRLVVTQ
jgi:hypothetical protein